MTMKLSKKVKYGLFILLIILNLILRFPVIHHELGLDSLEIHILANSVSAFGEARWWVHPVGIIGMYPNSYASATPFILSGVSQCTGLDVEGVMFIYGLIFGLFCMFAGYIVAGEIYDDDLFKFLVAFGFSTCQGVLTYTTWTAPARSPFIILLPLFLYALLKSRKHHLRFGLITIVLSMLLLATHHLAFYLVPIFAACFLVTIVYKLKEHIGVIKEVIKKTENFMPLFIIFAFCLMLAYPFMTHKFLSIGSRWDNLTLMFTEYPRYIGILVFLAIGGFGYLVFKPNKRYEEWTLLTMLMFLSVFVFDERYMKWFILIFAFLLAGVGLVNLFKLSEQEQKRKYVAAIVVIFLILSVFMSSFYQYWRTDVRMGGDLEFRTDYIEEGEHATGLWIKKHVEGVGISNDQHMGSRIGAISASPFFVGSYSDDQAYGFVDVRDWELEKVPITEEEFWMKSPYRRVKGLDADGYWVTLMKYEYDSRWGSELVSKFNLTYMVENTRLHGASASRHGVPPSPFLHSISDKKNNIYDNAKIRLWCLN